ncbi:MAG: thiamine phosphate synthase [Bacillus sp. (in: Bacteria)]|nr:thiamine phosphate synthase [Bacillus sp. (in: firmicutes)]
MEQFAHKAAILEPYVDYFHLREKTFTAQDLLEAVEVLKVQRIPTSKIIINDRVDVAAVSMTAGVQLAYHSLAVEAVKAHFPMLKVGKSVHSVEEAVDAEGAGADYLLYGHIFPTQSKPGLSPRGIGNLEKVARAVSIPVIAIGGIKPENAGQVMDAGAGGIAIMSGLLEAEDPLISIKNYVKLLGSR